MSQAQAGELLAVNLRALCEERGLSLSELARRAGIAKGTLSQLKSGTGNPTIETVFSLSNALNVPVSDLLTERVDPGVVLVRAAGTDVLSSNAVDLRMLRRLDVSATVFEIYDQRVRPGEVQRSEGHPGFEHVVVTTGRLRLGPPAAPYELEPGDYLCFDAQAPHIYEAVDGPVTSVLLLQYPVQSAQPQLGRPCVGEPRG